MSHIVAYKRSGNTLEILQIRQEKTKVVVESYQKCELSEESRVEDSVACIRKAISQSKANPSEIFPILPLSSCFVRKLWFPYTSLSRIRKTAKFALEPYIPLPIEEVKEFFIPLGKVHNTTGILCFALRKSLLEEEREILNQVGPNSYEMYLSPLAFFSAVANLLPETGEILWIDIREDSSQVQIIRQRKLLDLREVPYGDTHLPKEAEEWKREIDLFIHSHHTEKPDTEFDRVVVTGITQNIPQTLLEEQKDKLEVLNLEERIPVENKDFSPAPRLLYEMQGKRGDVNINFYPPGVREVERKRLITTVALCGVIFLGITVRLSTQRIIEGNRYRYLTSQIESVFRETFPQATDTRAPLLQMQSRLKELQNRTTGLLGLSGDRSSALNILHEVFRKIDKSLEVQLDSLHIGEDKVTLVGTTPHSYQAVDEIRGSLESSPLFSKVEIQSADLEKEKVQFRLEIQIAR